jgi:hypothetical protein
MLPESEIASATDTKPSRRRFDRIWLIQFLKWSSCVCTVVGGVLLASKTGLSPYGFLFLAMGSSQMVATTYLMRDRALFAYSVCVFLFVDCFGIYRWLLSGDA